MTGSRRSITVRALHVTRGKIPGEKEVHWITGGRLVWVAEFFEATGHMEYALACGRPDPDRMDLLGDHAALTCVACAEAWRNRDGSDRLGSVPARPAQE